MQRVVATTAPMTSLADVLNQMFALNVSSIVVASDNKPLGILTESDIVRTAARLATDLRRLCAHDVMSAPVLTAHPDTEIDEAYRLMTGHHVRHLVVLDDANELAGIVSEADFIGQYAPELFMSARTVDEIMSSTVDTVTAHDSVAGVIERMVARHFSCVVVAESGRAVGILTERDVVRIVRAGVALAETPVSAVMSQPVHTARRGMTVLAASQMMQAYAIRRVVVTDDAGTIAGLVTRHDLLKAIPGEHVDALRRIIELQSRALGEARQALDDSLVLEYVLGSIPENAILACDKDGVVRYCNAFARRLAGLPEAATGRPLPEDADRTALALLYEPGWRARIEAGEMLHREVSWRDRHDGRRRDLDTLLLSMSDAVGRYQGMLYIARDVTGQKQAARALRESEERFRHMADAAPVLLWMSGVDGFRSYFNKPWLGFTGRSLERELGNGWTQGLHPEDLQSCLDGYLSAFDARREFSLEYRLRRHDGVYRWIWDHGAPRYGESGEFLGYIGSCLDVTERRQAEDRLRQSAVVFESALEGVMITDAELRITAINGGFTRITGYEEADVLGKKPGILRSGHHDRDFYRAMWTSINETGAWAGEIVNRDKRGGLVPEWLSISAVRDDTGRVLNYVGVFSDMTPIKRSQERLEYLAHHDVLTGLPNRLLLFDRLKHALERAVRQGTMVAVLFIDLDRFKHINDGLGHTVGDALLQAVARRLKQLIRQGDTVARLGGDEFTVFLEGLKDGGHAALVAETIVRALGEPVRVENHELFISASIGISVFPRDGTSVETLLKNADTAMYRAKDAGRNTYHFFAEEMTSQAFERMVLESQLRRAIENGELLLHYQPQAALADGRVVAVEALLRWNHPDLGLVGPARFIPIAEESSLIVPLGEWALRSACIQAARWRREGLDFGRIAVNVSAGQMKRVNLADTVRQVLHEVGLPGDALELEITEGMLAEPVDQITGQFRALRELGVALAVDDFGTGYSSLSYLKSLPLDKLKLDQHFVRELPGDDNDVAIARAVIALGHSLQLSVIAEGVETEAQRDFLRAEGCDLVQGFLFGQPMAPEQLEQTLQVGC
jgi:diguanylate cyclase (GGDEF)-like protein/PAS domain S-box-containing protein